MGLLTESLLPGRLLPERVAVGEDVLAHGLVFGEDAARLHEVGTAHLDDVDDLDLGGAPADAVRTGGAGVHVPDQGLVGLEVACEQAVCEHDVSTMRPLERAESHPIDLKEGQTLLQKPHMVQQFTAFLTSSSLSTLNSDMFIPTSVL